MTTDNTTTPPRAAEVEYEKATAALEPHIVAMQARIDRAARDHNVLLTQVAVMGTVRNA